MPFQGNTNAGAFDPSLLSLLFSERDKRREAERQAMLDQANLQQQAMKLQMEQAKAAREEARAEALFNEDLMTKRLTNEATLKELRGGIEESAAAVPESIRRQAQGGYLSSRAPGNAVLTANLTGTEDSMRALNQLGMTDPQAVVAQGQQATAEIDRASTMTGDPATDKLLDYLEETTGLSRADLRLSGAVERNRAFIAQQGETESELEMEREKAKIQANKEKEVAQFTASLSDGAEGRKFLDRNSKIRNLISRAEAIEKKDPNSIKARQLREDAAGLAAIRDADLTRGQPETAVSNMRLLVELQQRLDLGVNLQKTISDAASADAIGAPAAVERFTSNIAGLVNDLGAFIGSPESQFDAVLNNPSVPPELRERLTSILIRGMDPDRQRQLTASELAVQRARWFIVVEGSRGRVSLTELRELGRVIDPNGFFTSTLRARGRAAELVGTIQNANDTLRRSLKVLKPEASFDPDGRLSVGSLPSIEGLPEIPQDGRVQIDTTPPPNPIEMLRDPNATMGDALRKSAAEAKRQALERSRGARKP